MQGGGGGSGRCPHGGHKRVVEAACTTDDGHLSTHIQPAQLRRNHYLANQMLLPASWRALPQSRGSTAPEHHAGEILLLGGVPLAGDQHREAITSVRDEACRPGRTQVLGAGMFRIARQD